MLKMPRLIPQDKANHYLRGSQVAAVFAALAMVVGFFALLQLNRPMPSVVFGLGIAAAGVSAYVAGRLVERWQSIQNVTDIAEGRPMSHSIEKADVRYTSLGALPVALPLVVLFVISLRSQ